MEFFYVEIMGKSGREPSKIMILVGGEVSGFALVFLLSLFLGYPIQQSGGGGSTLRPSAGGAELIVRAEVVRS